MAGIFERLDRLAGVDDGRIFIKWLERAAFIFLFLMVVTCPHSIAASQSAWLIGLTLTVVRLVLRPRAGFRFKAIDLALWALFLWAVISSVFSYEPATSLDKLRGVGLFLVFYFAYLNIRNLSAVYFLAFALIFSTMLNVVWTIGDRINGRGVEVHGVATDGPLGKLHIIEGATIVSMNGKKLNSPDDLISTIERDGTAKAVIYQYDEYESHDLTRSDLLPGSSAAERLGIAGWSRSYNWRAQGFFSHFTTYAEALQLVASLLFGLIVASITKRKKSAANGWASRLTSLPVLLVILGGILLALLLTVTRASQLAFMVSAFTIVVVSGNRKLLLAAVLIAIPVILGGLLFLQESRQVGFIDTSDNSTTYRMTMWRDGMRLSTASARNLIFGIGMDSTKKHWQEWGMFEGGMLPMGHFHSTPIQLMVERGVPSLLIWLALLGIYLVQLWRSVSREKEKRRRGEEETWALGILLGCLGAAIGFFVSGLVHYNLGDGEVAMIFFLVMAFGVRAAEFVGGDPAEAAENRMEYRMAA